VTDKENVNSLTEREGDNSENSSSTMAALVEHFRKKPGNLHRLYLSGSITPTGSVENQIIRPIGIPSEEKFGAPTITQPGFADVDTTAAISEKEDDSPAAANYPDILLQAAVINLGGSTSDGRLVIGVSVAWFEIIKQLERDPNFLYQIPPRKLEELIAGAYERAGFSDVILTPRSGDLGRDIIATKPGFYSIRIIDQIKAYSPGRRVSADEVRALLGVLLADQNASKGLVTTTAEFAPRIDEDKLLKPFMPYRLDLKNGEQLKQWLFHVSSSNVETDTDQA
jgi:restriction system protein